MNLKKFTRIGVLLLSALSVVFLATIMGSDAPDGGMILPFISVSYIAVFVATGLVLYYSIKNLMASKNIKKTLMPFALFILLFVFSYVIANSDPFIKNEVEILSSSGSKLVSAGLNMVYILALAAFGLLIYSSFARFKK